MQSLPFKLFSFFMRHSRGLIILAVFVGIIAGVSSVALMALISKRVADPHAPVMSFCLPFIGIAIIDLVATLLSGFLSIYITQKTNLRLRMHLSRHVLDAPLRQLEQIGSHRILATLTQDIPALTGALLRLPQFCINAAILLGGLLYLGWLSPTMLYGLLFFLILAVISYLIPQKKAKQLMKLARDDWDSLVSHFRALTEGSKELKLHRRRRESFFSNVLQATAVSLEQNNMVSGRIYSLLNSWSQMLYFIVIGLILSVLPLLVGSGANAYVLTGYALTVLYMRGPLMILIGLIPGFNSARISLQRIEELGLSLAISENDEQAAGPYDPDPSWERLDLIGVTHTYYREREDGTFTLGPIDMTLRPGEMVFIVGGNGSGKTTLAKLLTGLYAPENGEVRINSEVVTDDNRDHYRQYFSAVFTDFYLFDKLLGFSEQDLDERARKYLTELQLDHKVKVNGGDLSTTDLSYGQRKRLALLTAYLEDRPIYLFDEWAAGQDPIFKETFYFQILPELKARGKTVIVISHDDRYYGVADRIIKLDYGKIEYDRAANNQVVDRMPGQAPSVSGIIAG